MSDHYEYYPVYESSYLRFEIRLKVGSTLQSIPNRRQREHAAAGV